MIKKKEKQARELDKILKEFEKRLAKKDIKELKRELQHIFR